MIDETDHGTLEEGTYVFAFRTDGKTWIDLQEIPASRVTDERSDHSEWSLKAAGKEETEAFRGIQYAG